jgi:hypothetical protein
MVNLWQSTKNGHRWWCSKIFTKTLQDEFLPMWPMWWFNMPKNHIVTLWSFSTSQTVNVYRRKRRTHPNLAPTTTTTRALRIGLGLHQMRQALDVHFPSSRGRGAEALVGVGHGVTCEAKRGEVPMKYEMLGSDSWFIGFSIFGYKL